MNQRQERFLIALYEKVGKTKEGFSYPELGKSLGMDETESKDTVISLKDLKFVVQAPELKLIFTPHGRNSIYDLLEAKRPSTNTIEPNQPAGGVASVVTPPMAIRLPTVEPKQTSPADAGTDIKEAAGTPMDNSMSEGVKGQTVTLPAGPPLRKDLVSIFNDPAEVERRKTAKADEVQLLKEMANGSRLKDPSLLAAGLKAHQSQKAENEQWKVLTTHIKRQTRAEYSGLNNLPRLHASPAGSNLPAETQAYIKNAVQGGTIAIAPNVRRDGWTTRKLKFLKWVWLAVWKVTQHPLVYYPIIIIAGCWIYAATRWNIGDYQRHPPEPTPLANPPQRSLPKPPQVAPTVPTTSQTSAVQTQATTLK